MSSDDEGLAPEAKIYRHSEPVPSEGFAVGDAEIIDAVTAHIERCIGPVDGVFHELVSEYVHVDVHHVPPSPERPFHVLVTSGMSERPMNTPPELTEDDRRAELLMCLPSEWPLNDEAFRKEKFYWPVRWLKTLARFPHQWGTWLGFAHTIPNGDPAKPLGPGTKQAGLLLSVPSMLGEEAHRLVLADGRVVHFWSVVPVYKEEMDLKLEKGAEALFERFGEVGITDLIDPDRPNAAGEAAAARKWWQF